MLSSNTSAVSGDANYIESVFSTYLYTGNDSTQNIVNGIDLSTKGGMVWLKGRSLAVGHYLYDTVRGIANGPLSSENTNAAYTANTPKTLTSFNTNGFSMQDDSASFGANVSPRTQASWTFRKQAKFFDVVTYTGNGTNGRTVAHSLGSEPGCIIVKASSGASHWSVYHRSIGNTGAVRLNLTGATDTSIYYWNNTSPTSTEFSVANETNSNGVTYVAYLFAHDAGGFGLTGTDNVISCGSTGGGSSEITLGWEPQWLLYKSSTAVDGWHIIDNMRGAAVGSPTYHTWSNLDANTSAAETSVTGSGGNPNIRFTPTGFILGAIAGTAIYIAIRRGPMKVPTDATKVFAPIKTTAASGTTLTTGFPVDLQFQRKQYTLNTTYTMKAIDRLRGISSTSTESGPYLQTSATTAETAGSTTLLMNNTGYQVSSYNNGDAQIYWNFGRAPSFFDEVCYTGTGSPTTISHNLGAVPQFMIVKCRNTVTDWWTYNATNGNSGGIRLNTTDAFGATGIWSNTTPTSSVFSISGSTPVNASGNTYVAYLFATCAGVSKVGSYTGTGTTKQVDCGFAAGARFVLIKRTDSTGDWYVWDTARGIVSGNDPYLLLNSTAAEVTSTDYIDTYSAGFELSSTAPAALNASGGTYIFLAIA